MSNCPVFSTLGKGFPKHEGYLQNCARCLSDMLRRVEEVEHVDYCSQTTSWVCLVVLRDRRSRLMKRWDLRGS